MMQQCEILRFWEARRGQPLALATLVAVRGSGYRRPGARMLIDARGASAGGVSAGCIEEQVAACAAKVLRSGLPEMMTFDTRLRFGCHGSIEILVEPAAEELLMEWQAWVRMRRRCTLVTDLHGGRRGTRIGHAEAGPGAFVQIIEPVLRLVVTGNGAETAPLRGHAALLGWDVVSCETPPTSESLHDDRTAVVLATHHFGRDCSALKALLPLGLRYLGLVGSRRRREDLLFEVIQSGVAATSALFAPAGLDLGAETPEEIALAIVTEIQCVFGGGTGRPLRQRQTPIHQPDLSASLCVASAA